jgi:D-alanyl-D-alanine carboxypeptidase
VDAALPPAVAREARARIEADPAGFTSLLSQVESDSSKVPDLLKRVDKVVALGSSYAPADLVPLDKSALTVSRPGHRLRKPAFEALLKMSAAARADRVTLVVGSAYRSYEYQVEVFSRTVREEGSEAAADRISARPGKSQHQLGMVIDFSPIDDSFAKTAASRWLAAKAGAYGFSLSFPKGYEPVTGYAWESWHYRYIGVAAVELQRRFFGDVQQYLVEFWEAYAKG